MAIGTMSSDRARRRIDRPTYAFAGPKARQAALQAIRSLSFGEKTWSRIGRFQEPARSRGQNLLSQIRDALDLETRKRVVRHEQYDDSRSSAEDVEESVPTQKHAVPGYLTRAALAERLKT